MTFLELFAQAHLSSQKISIEANLPLSTVYRMRDGKSSYEHEVQRVLDVVNSRLGTHIQPGELTGIHIITGERPAPDQEVRDHFGKVVYEGLIAGTNILAKPYPTDREIKYCGLCCKGCPKEMKPRAFCYFTTVDICGKEHTWYACNRQHAGLLHIDISAADRGLCTCSSYICGYHKMQLQSLGVVGCNHEIINGTHPKQIGMRYRGRLTVDGDNVYIDGTLIEGVKASDIESLYYGHYCYLSVHNDGTVANCGFPPD